MSTPAEVLVDSKKLASLWWIFFLRGTALLILGILLIIAPEMTMVTLILLIGIYWLIGGFFSFIEIFLKSSNLHWVWLLVSGILGIVAGILVLRHPLISTVFVLTVLVLILAINGLIMGTMYLIRGIKGDGAGHIFLGIIDIIFGIILLANPLIAATILPIIIGIFAIIGGFASTAFAFRIRKA